VDLAACRGCGDMRDPTPPPGLRADRPWSEDDVVKPACAATSGRYAFAEGQITYGCNVEQSGGSAAGFGHQAR
jgi:hypothetical protein